MSCGNWEWFTLTRSEVQRAERLLCQGSMDRRSRSPLRRCGTPRFAPKKASRSTCHWKVGTKPLFRISTGSEPDVQIYHGAD